MLKSLACILELHTQCDKGPDVCECWCHAGQRLQDAIAERERKIAESKARHPSTIDSVDQ